MAVIARIIGEDDGSDEFAAAKKLKDIIDTTIPRTAMGEIILFPSATLYGQAVKDVDIMMIGSLRNYGSRVPFYHDGSNSEEEVFLDSFCTTIEVKAHSANAVRIEGTNFQVLYSNKGWHNATKQSNEQKTSAMNFFFNTLGESPFITNLLWFVEMSDAELKHLLSNGEREMPSNALPSTFDFKVIVEKMAQQRSPKKYASRYSIECGFNGKEADSVVKPLMLFSKAKNGVGELTRKRIEQIVDAELSDFMPEVETGKLNIFRGKAGTGKTINLIKLAIKLVDSEEARVQILTYNRALVSDIRRLFALAQLPDMFQAQCVSVNTMQSYFFGLINGCLYNGLLSGEDFLTRYDELLGEMVDFLKSDHEAREVVKAICEDNPKLNWDYILIDEAQDWTSLERDLILMLFDKSRVIIADGGQQFVRNIAPCDWTMVSDRNNIKLKHCLRQKRNLVRFANHFIDLLDIKSSKIIASENLIGGKVILVRNRERFFHTIKVARSDLKKAENEPYDMLFVVPSSCVETVDSHRRFKGLKEFEKNGFLLWDGTDENKRLEYSINMDESRVVQYESARGLEGWTVCCIDFDEFLQGKENQFEPVTEGNSLFLESKEDQRKKYLLNWALIPFTRAIDTLIITVANEESVYSKLLLKIAEECSDYIQVV